MAARRSAKDAQMTPAKSDAFSACSWYGLATKPNDGSVVEEDPSKDGGWFDSSMIDPVGD